MLLLASGLFMLAIVLTLLRKHLQNIEIKKIEKRINQYINEQQEIEKTEGSEAKKEGSDPGRTT